MHLVQQFRGVSLGFLTGVCVNIHCGRHIRMTKKLLHILRRCAIGQQIGGEGMSEKMEMKLSQIRYYRSCSAADAAYRCGGFKGSVQSYTQKIGK